MKSNDAVEKCLTLVIEVDRVSTEWFHPKESKLLILVVCLQRGWTTFYLEARNHFIHFCELCKFVFKLTTYVWYLCIPLICLMKVSKTVCPSPLYRLRAGSHPQKLVLVCRMPLIYKKAEVWVSQKLWWHMFSQLLKKSVNNSDLSVKDDTCNRWPVVQYDCSFCRQGKFGFSGDSLNLWKGDAAKSSSSEDRWLLPRRAKFQQIQLLLS